MLENEVVVGFGVLKCCCTRDGICSVDVGIDLLGLLGRAHEPLLARVVTTYAIMVDYFVRWL
jgi:hypothetical protein